MDTLYSCRENKGLNKIVKITNENFREMECEYAKYVSRIKGKLILYIIDFQDFRQRLLDEYTEDEIRQFFRIFPYTLDSEVNEKIKYFMIRQEVEYYEDLQLIEIELKEYALGDESSELLEGWYLFDRIESQPILFEGFITIVFDDFVPIDTGPLLLGARVNVKEKDKKEGELKYVESGAEGGVYI